MQTIIKDHALDSNFRKSFEDWTIENHGTLDHEMDVMFTTHAQSKPNEWTREDFKRWILEGNQWTIQVEIKGKVFRIPLNLACLFGVKVKP